MSCKWSPDIATILYCGVHDSIVFPRPPMFGAKKETCLLSVLSLSYTPSHIFPQLIGSQWVRPLVTVLLGFSVCYNGLSPM